MNTIFPPLRRIADLPHPDRVDAIQCEAARRVDRQANVMAFSKKNHDVNRSLSKVERSPTYAHITTGRQIDEPA
jgi:hypothetical protein